jgi:hypothetical protein
MVNARLLKLSKPSPRSTQSDAKVIDGDVKDILQRLAEKSFVTFTD